MIKVPGYYEARKKVRQPAARTGPTPIPVVVLDPKEFLLVVVQSLSEVSEATRDKVQGRVVCLVTKTGTMMGRVQESLESRKDFEERIKEIDRELEKFDTDKVHKLDNDIVTILGETRSCKNIQTSWDSTRRGRKETSAVLGSTLEAFWARS